MNKTAALIFFISITSPKFFIFLFFLFFKNNFQYNLWLGGRLPGRLLLNQQHGIPDRRNPVGLVIVDGGPEDVLALDDDIHDPGRIDLQVLEDVGFRRRLLQQGLIFNVSPQDINNFLRNLFYTHCFTSHNVIFYYSVSFHPTEAGCFKELVVISNGLLN